MKYDSKQIYSRTLLWYLMEVMIYDWVRKIYENYNKIDAARVLITIWSRILVIAVIILFEF